MQVFANGLIQGFLYALMGLSFALVYNTTRTFHVALGGIYALAPYLLWSCLSYNFPLALLITFFICGAVGLLCEEILHWPFLRKSAPPEIHLIGSLGMFLVIIQLIAIIWGNDFQVLRKGMDTVYVFINIRLSSAQLIGGIVSFFTLILFFSWFKYSSLGIQFRAMADNPILLSLLGKNIRKLRRLVFIISAIMASVVAIAFAYDIGFDPNGGLRMVLIGMIATIVGGRGSFIGAAVAGIILGVIRSQVVWYSSARWEEAATFLILALILLLRPQGLLGQKLRMEEKV